MNITEFNKWLADDHKNTIIMGILNVTPDSFSDGGNYSNTEVAVERTLEMIEEGANIIDIGGESSRPGATPTPLDVELERVIPVIADIRKKSDIVISIDTYKSKVAEAAINAGANIINDISGTRFDERMASLVGDLKVPIIIMHMLGSPQTMQDYPTYSNLIDELVEFFAGRVKTLNSQKVTNNKIILDPGIGFGKSTEDNYELICKLQKIVNMGFTVMVGPSRKSFIGKTLDLPVNDRIEGTAVAVALAIEHGARIVRIHDIKEMSRVVKMTENICGIC